MTKGMVGYELFLPTMAAMFRGKKKEDDSLTSPEFKAIVQVIFRDAVTRFMKDSKLFRIEIPIDVYKGVTYYPLNAPEGYYIESSMALKAGRSNLPLVYDLTEDYLDMSGCCPKYDINRALYVEVALVPYRSGGDCLFDEKFVNKYYDVILAFMMYMFAQMDQRRWSSKSTIQFLRSEYRKMKKKAIVGGSDSSKPIKLSYRKASDGDGMRLQDCLKGTRHKNLC